MAFEFKKCDTIADTIEPTPPDSAQRVCITQYDESGNMVVRTYGHSPNELQDLHDAHRCDAFCGICYAEAMKSVGLSACKFDAQDQCPTPYLCNSCDVRPSTNKQ